MSVDLDMWLAPHFRLRELLVTEHRAHIAAQQDPPAQVVACLQAVALDLLEPIRMHFGAPVVVHSGWRSPALNAAIGGAVASQHLTGQAADIHVQGVALERVWRWVHEESSIRFGQLILEGWGRSPSWIHISLGAPWRDPARCGEVLRMSQGAYTTIARGVRVAP